MDKEIIISIKAIVALLLMLLTAWVVLQIMPVLLALFISLLLALTLTPLVDWCQEKKIPRGVSTTLLFVVLLFVFTTVGVAGVKPIFTQMSKLLEFVPDYIQSTLGLQDNVFNLQLQDAVTGQLNQSSGRVINVTVGLFSNALFLISVLVFTFYLLVEFDEVKRLFVSSFPAGKRKGAENLVNAIERTLGSYLRGQLILGLVVGVFTYIGLTLLGIEYALSLAIFAGVLEIVPVIGPILSAIPALIVAIGGGLWSIIGVALLYILIQQLENNVLVPQVMSRTVGLNPLVTLIILLTGGTLFGVIGLILSIPTALIAYLIATELLPNFFEL